MVEFTVYKGSKDGRIVQDTTSKEVGLDEVLVRVTHSGLCGTDVHYKTTDIVLGHEGAGVVEELGKNIKTLKIGQRVGWGYQHDACGHCKQCLRGFETFCPERHMYGSAEVDQGSLATYAVWKADFLFAIPDAIKSEDAAPLMCGGATVFNALQLHGVRSTDRVGIVGVGGLGHLAIQFAAAMGCGVVVFSGTDNKKEEAIKLGAKEFYATKGVKELKVQPLDHLLVCTSAQPDWSIYLPIMAPSGTIYPLSVSGGVLSLPYMPVLMAGLKIQGSLVAARQIHREMLEFAAIHHIQPIIERFSMNVQGVEQAFKKLEEGNMRYRGVIAV